MSTHGSLTDSDYQELSHDLARLRLELQAVQGRQRACEDELARQRLEASRGLLRLSAVESFVYRFRQLLQSLLGFNPAPAQGEP